MTVRGAAWRFWAAVAISIALITADLQLSAFDSLRGSMSLSLTPMRYAAKLPQTTWRVVKDYFGSRRALLEEKAALEEKLLRQSVRLRSLDFFFAQNNELRSILSLPEQRPGRWLAADVQRETAQLQSDRIYLNRGIADGVVPGMTVIDNKGVIGQIVRADADSSVVNLLSNRRQWIAARVRRTGQLAILRGQGSNEMIASMSVGADVQFGDELIADGGFFPLGYPVGTVARVLRGVQYIETTVTPASDFYDNHTVLIFISDENTAAQEAEETPS